MPKIKTHKGAKKRLYVTGTGKIMRMKIGRSHLRLKKPKRVRRSYHDKLALHPALEKRINKILRKD